jgi:hypothetical protein
VDAVGTPASAATVRWVTPATPSRSMIRSVAAMSSVRRFAPRTFRPSTCSFTIG